MGSAKEKEKNNVEEIESAHRNLDYENVSHKYAVHANSSRTHGVEAPRGDGPAHSFAVRSAGEYYGRSDA